LQFQSTDLTESEERTWREVFGDGGNRTLAANETTIAEEEEKKKGNKQRRHLSPLPMANSFLALPPIDEVDEEEENGTSTNAEANGMEEGWENKSKFLKIFLNKY
jgi:hypothetical protein